MGGRGSSESEANSGGHGGSGAVGFDSGQAKGISAVFI